jgi:methyl acetate hydrolase
MVTGLALMQLYERGQLDLDAPVGEYVPELNEVDVIIESYPEIKTRKAKTPITTRMLLNHTAGTGYSWYNIHMKRWANQDPQAFAGSQLDMPLVNEPGTKWEYGVNLDWAGIVLERVMGMKLGDYCQGEFPSVVN